MKKTRAKKIKKGQLVEIKHNRKGTFLAVASEDFSTKDEWYPVAVAQPKTVKGLNTEWEEGDPIPCRGEFCSKVVKK